MSNLNFSSENNYKEFEKNLKAEINTCRKIIDEGKIFLAMDTVEETMNNCVENENYTDGIYFIERLLEISPYNSDYWYKKGVLLNIDCKYENAIECFNKAISLNPGDVEIYLDKSISEEGLDLNDEAVKSLEIVLELEPTNDEAYYNLGMIAFRETNFIRAKECFLKTINLNYESKEVYFDLASCSEALNEYENAIKFIDMYLETYPYNENAWYNKGVFLSVVNRKEEAVSSFDFALAINDEFARAWFNKGIIVAELGQLHLALECFINSYKYDSFDENTVYNIANIYADLNKNEKAIEYFTKTIKLNKEYVSAYLGRAQSYFIQGHCISALNDYKIAVNISREDKEAWLGKAEIEYSLGKLNDACISYKNIIRIEPENFNANFKLAQILFELGNYNDSIKSFIECIEIDKNNYIPYFYLTRIYSIIGDPVNAKNYFILTLNYGPNLDRRLKSEFPEIEI